MKIYPQWKTKWFRKKIFNEEVNLQQINKYESKVQLSISTKYDKCVKWGELISSTCMELRIFKNNLNNWQ